MIALDSEGKFIAVGFSTGLINLYEYNYFKLVMTIEDHFMPASLKKKEALLYQDRLDFYIGVKLLSGFMTVDPPIHSNIRSQSMALNNNDVFANSFMSGFSIKDNMSMIGGRGTGMGRESFSLRVIATHHPNCLRQYLVECQGGKITKSLLHEYFIEG